MKRINWALALIGMLLSLASCDKGEEIEKPYVRPFDHVRRCWIDGKRMPDATICLSPDAEVPYHNSYDLALRMNK